MLWAFAVGVWTLNVLIVFALYLYFIGSRSDDS